MHPQANSQVENAGLCAPRVVPTKLAVGTCVLARCSDSWHMAGKCGHQGAALTGKLAVAAPACTSKFDPASTSFSMEACDFVVMGPPPNQYLPLALFH